MIKKGDILLVHCYLDPIALLISFATKSKWTHTTWILDKKSILESRSSGVIKSPIRKYLGKKWLYQCKLLRLKGNKTVKIKKAMRYGLKLRKNRGYWRFIWSLIQIGFNRRNQESQISCSGFVSYCFSKVDIYLHKTKDPLDVTPGDIARSKELIDVTDQL